MSENSAVSRNPVVQDETFGSVKVRQEQAGDRPAAATPPKSAIIVGTMTGGQGKTLVSSLVAMGLAGRLSRIYDIVGMDSVATSNGEKSDASKSKLELFLGSSALLKPHQLSTIAIDLASDEEREGFFDPRALNRHLHDLAGRMRKENMLVDLGANLIDRFLSFLQVSDASAKIMSPEKVLMTVVIPFSNDDVSVHRATATLEKIRSMKHAFQVVIVRNLLNGPIMTSDSNVQKLANLANQMKAIDLTLPACRAKGLKYFSGKGGINSARHKKYEDPESYGTDVGIDSVFEAAVDQEEMTRWFTEQAPFAARIIAFAETGSKPDLKVVP